MLIKKTIEQKSVKIGKEKMLKKSALTSGTKTGILYKKFKEGRFGLSLKGSSRNTSSTSSTEWSGDVYQEFEWLRDF